MAEEQETAIAQQAFSLAGHGRFVPGDPVTANRGTMQQLRRRNMVGDNAPPGIKAKKKAAKKKAAKKKAK